MLGKNLKFSHSELSEYLRKNRTFSANERVLRKIVEDVSQIVGLPPMFLLTVLRYEIDFPHRPDWMNTKVRNGSFVGVMQTGAGNWYDCLEWVQIKRLPYTLPRSRTDATLEEQIGASFLYFERYRSKAKLANRELTPVAFYLLHNQGPGAVAKGVITRAAYQAQSDALRPVLRQHFKVV